MELPTPPAQALEPAAAAGLLGVSERWVRKRLRDPLDTLAGYRKPNGRWVIDAESIESVTPPRPTSSSPGEDDPLAVHLALAESRITELELARRDDELARLRAENTQLRSELAEALATLEVLIARRRHTVESTIAST